MPKTDRRFEIAIPFIVEEVVDGEKVPFFECELKYHDVPYSGTVAVQVAMVELLERLTQLGFVSAAAMGQAEELAVLLQKPGK